MAFHTDFVVEDDRLSYIDIKLVGSFMSSQLIVLQDPVENASSCNCAYRLMFLFEGKTLRQESF